MQIVEGEIAEAMQASIPEMSSFVIPIVLAIVLIIVAIVVEKRQRTRIPRYDKKDVYKGE